MKILEFYDYNLKSQTILNESWQALTESQRNYVGRWEKELWPLLEEYSRLAEAELTKDQILNIFKSAEQTAMSGDNKTALGKIGAAAKLPVDIAKKVNAKIDELGRLAQQAGPVQNADAKFDKLVADIKSKNTDSKIVQGIQKVSDWAKANPGKASLAVAVLTTVAAFAGGPAGGAAAGLVLRATKDLLRGDKLSTAAGKAVKGAAFGALAGGAVDIITDQQVDALQNASEEDLKGLEQSLKDPNVEQQLKFIKTDIQEIEDFAESVFGSGAQRIDAQYQVNGTLFSFNTVLTGDERVEFYSLDSITDQIKFLDQVEKSPEYQSRVDLWFELWESRELLMKDLKLTTELQQELADQAQQALNTASDDYKAQLSNFQNMMDIIDSAAQGAGTVASKKKQESIAEAPVNFMTKAKQGLGKAAKSVAGAASRAGKELGNKVTVNKLVSAWKKAGSPTDSGAIMDILSSAGLDNDQISQIGQETKVKFEPKADTPAEPKADTPASTPTAQAKPTAPKAQAKPAAQTGQVDLKSLADEIKKSGKLNQVKKALASDDSTDLKSLADEIKKSGLADQIKQMLQK